MNKDIANVVVCGAGWWSQTKHLPLLASMENVNILAIIEPSFHPTSTIVELDDCEQLSRIYKCTIFKNIDEFLESSELVNKCDGIIICTPHSTHYEIGIKCIQSKLNILMEKPMTTDVEEAKLLYEQTLNYEKIFQINNSANWRPKCREIYEIITKRNELGDIKLIHAYFGVNLGFLFEDKNATGWYKKTGNMLGNGLCWGQLSHTLSFLYHVTSLTPQKAFAFTTNSEVTEADIFCSISIQCTNGCLISISGVGVNPAYRNNKEIDNIIVGSKGRLRYQGLVNCDNKEEDKGSLQILLNNGDSITYDGFEFENLSVSPGPESLHNFIDGILGKSYYCGASCLVGYKVVATLDATYRAAISQKAELIVM